MEACGAEEDVGGADIYWTAGQDTQLMLQEVLTALDSLETLPARSCYDGTNRWVLHY